MKRLGRIVKLSSIACLAFALTLLAACGSGNFHDDASSSASSHSASTAPSPSGQTYSPNYENMGREIKIPEGAIEWSEASQHVGEVVSVFGTVKGSKYASTSKGRPTFIDIGAGYPDKNRLTVTIWGENRGAVSPSPEAMYEGKTLCVTGEVYLYDGASNIEVSSPDQIAVL